MNNPFYVLSLVLVMVGFFFSKNNKIAAAACFLVAVLAAFVGTYH